MHLLKKPQINTFHFLGISLSLLAGHQTSYSNTCNRPNIILIMADDLGYGDLGCYGQTKIKTPNIDKIASEGILFTQAYAGSTVCAPSRSSLMTGFHNGHNRIRDNLPHGIFLQPDDFTVAELLKRAGYVTGGIGKWSLGNPGSWGVPICKGFDYYYGHLNQDQAHFYYPHYLWENDQIVLLSGNRGERKEEYTHDLFTEKALWFIEKNKQKPFFLYLPYTVPHFSDYSSDSPDYFIVPSDEPYSSRNWTQTQKNYAAMVTMLDRDVGKIVDLLYETGISKNTLIIITSDNGPLKRIPEIYDFFNSSGPFRGGKRDKYEGGIRVPFIVKWPEIITKPGINNDIIAFWDILPTLAEIVNYPSEFETDGISFLPSLKWKPKKVHDYLYWDYGHTRETFIQAVRFGQFKGIRSITGLEVEFELYDLEKDPSEKNNIAHKHEYIVNEITTIMEEAYVYDEAYPRKVPDINY